MYYGEAATWPAGSLTYFIVCFAAARAKNLPC